jgi:PmbA protein
VVEEFVLETLLSNLSGAAVSHGESHFRQEQFGGDPVLRADLGLRIDPLLPLRSGNYRYTGEGVPAAPFAFIEGGRLLSPVLDLSRPPTPAPSSADTLFFEGAARLSLEQALDLAHGSVLVLSVLGVHTQDSASGDFSLAAPQTLAVGPEGLGGKVPATLSGNVFDLLRDDGLRLVEFEDEHTPGLLVRCRLDPR